MSLSKYLDKVIDRYSCAPKAKDIINYSLRPEKEKSEKTKRRGKKMIRPRKRILTV